jgi:hypothetical protein
MRFKEEERLVDYLSKKEEGKLVEYISKSDIVRIDERIDALYMSCNLEPIASYINELSIEFSNRGDESLKFFNLTSFKKKVTELEITIENYFDRLGVNRVKALSGIFDNRMMYEVHNTTKFQIRCFSCIELANGFIKREMKAKNVFKLAKVFNNHYETMHTPYF